MSGEFFHVLNPCVRVEILFFRSCYNAFSAFDDLETLAIDIAPADEVNDFQRNKYNINCSPLVSASYRFSSFTSTTVIFNSCV